MKETILAWSLVGIISTLIFAGIALLYVVVLPLLAIWVNFWLLDYVLYPHTNLTYVPDALVYLVSMLECAIGGVKLPIKRD